MTTRTIAILGAAVVVGCAAGPDGARVLPTSYDGTLTVTPVPVVFEATRAGCVRSLALDLANASPDREIEVTNVTLPDPALSLGQRLPIAVGPGAHRVIDLHFTPEAAGRIAGDAEITTDEGRIHPLEVPVRAVSTARSDGSVVAAPIEPLDLVFVLDVSTTMNEIARLRDAIEAVYPWVETQGGEVRFGLTTFTNDVHVHAHGAFLERSAFFDELDSQLLAGRWVPDPDRPRQLLNFDHPENALDALERSAVEFEFRDGARRFLLLMTDDTFLEPPAVFSDGTPAVHSFAETADALVERGIRLFSIHAPLLGAGLSSAHEGAPSLVSATGGAWFEISDVDRGTLSLEALLLDLIAGRTCS